MSLKYSTGLTLNQKFCACELRLFKPFDSSRPPGGGGGCHPRFNHLDPVDPLEA
jgi:hypothetical protein